MITKTQRTIVRNVYTCDICGKEFSTVAAAEKHNFSKHVCNALEKFLNI